MHVFAKVVTKNHAKNALFPTGGDRAFWGFVSSAFEAVLQGNSPVEDQMIGSCIPIVQAEIALPHELEAIGGLAVLGMGISVRHSSTLQPVRTWRLSGLR